MTTANIGGIERSNIQNLRWRDFLVGYCVIDDRFPVLRIFECVFMLYFMIKECIIDSHSVLNAKVAVVVMKFLVKFLFYS